MSNQVLCLRPEIDFTRVGAPAPSTLNVRYLSPDDHKVGELLKEVGALVIPAVGKPLPKELFKNSSIKIVQVTGAGVDRLDQDAMKSFGIPVANMPGGSNQAVAEYVLTSALILSRRLMWSSHEIRQGNYSTFRTRMLSDNLAGLEGQMIGLIGLGVIGLAVAKAFLQFGCRVRFYDPAPKDLALTKKLGMELVPLDEILQQSDIISLHIPLLPETQGMIGDKRIGQMKPGAILIQASRGGIVDEKALAEHLQSGHLGGAAVDVFLNEPIANDNPLLSLTGDANEKLLLTPHIAGVSRQSFSNLFRGAWENVERVLVQGESPKYRVF
jgi:phosphoglycerate dehydrogenase-like enzyme